LAAVCRTNDPRRAIDRAAEVIVVAPLDYPRVQAATHAQWHSMRGGRIGERLLQSHRRSECVHCIVEGRVHAVAGHLHHRAVMTLDRLARKRVVGCQRWLHPLGLLLPQADAAFDVGEQERYRASRQRSVGAIRL
jgi:hypothetical protein